jgi:hypothetical protein
MEKRKIPILNAYVENQRYLVFFFIPTLLMLCVVFGKQIQRRDWKECDHEGGLARKCWFGGCGRKLIWFFDRDSRDTLLEGEGEFGDSLAELGDGDSGGSGGLGEEGGFGHAGDGVGFEDVSAGDAVD